MEIVYNPPAKEHTNLSTLGHGELFKLSDAQTVYMKIEPSSSIHSHLAESSAIGLKDGGIYGFTDTKVTKLNGKLTVWEV